VLFLLYFQLYQWFVDSVEFISGLKADARTSKADLETSLRDLETFVCNDPYDTATFDTTHQRISALDNSFLSDRWAVAHLRRIKIDDTLIAKRSDLHAYIAKFNRDARCADLAVEGGTIPFTNTLHLNSNCSMKDITKFIQSSNTVTSNGGVGSKFGIGAAVISNPNVEAIVFDRRGKGRTRVIVPMVTEEEEVDLKQTETARPPSSLTTDSGFSTLTKPTDLDFVIPFDPEDYNGEFLDAENPPTAAANALFNNDGVVTLRKRRGQMDLLWSTSTPVGCLNVGVPWRHSFTGVPSAAFSGGRNGSPSPAAPCIDVREYMLNRSSDDRSCMSMSVPSTSELSPPRPWVPSQSGQVPPCPWMHTPPPPPPTSRNNFNYNRMSVDCSSYDHHGHNLNVSSPGFAAAGGFDA